MILYDNNTIESTNGGYSEGGQPIYDTYVQISRSTRGIMYQPLTPGRKVHTAVVVIHSDTDYSVRPICGELAKRGYTVFGGSVGGFGITLDVKLLEIKRVIAFLRDIGAKKIVLLGHSGGATLMTAYQAAAESELKALRREELVYTCRIEEVLPPADGVMLLDANWGNGAMTLLSVDPAVIEEGNGVKLDPELDIFNPANGYDPAGCHYSEAFKKRFYAAQRERSNRLIRLAQERLFLIEHGKGRFNDDEPFIVAGGEQGAPSNRMIPQDTNLLAHTKNPYTLLLPEGKERREIIRCRRLPEGFFPGTPLLGESGLITTVRCYLSGQSVLAEEDFHVGDDGVYGVDWNSSYCCGVGNARHFRAPLLCMGMTAGYEYLAAEEIYLHADSPDKSIAFVEGATHLFTPDARAEAYPGEFGDTQKTLYDAADRWISEHI